MECKCSNPSYGYYSSPKENIIIRYCVECYQKEHPLNTKPFITRYGRKLIEKQKGQ
jgi:hypothetical protein